MRVNIYIRKEDEEKWKALPNKAEWLSYHLNNPVKYSYKLSKANESVATSLPPPPQSNIIKQSNPVGRNEFKFLNDTTCPHGYAKGMCKRAECNKKFRKD